ncbi:hypothetical protein [Pontibacter toksunensis]|uniref:hypothetical protein n=1 Tax=Pontibacter toksunensis TaxID=1332631 RepID=UPI00366DD281
MQTAETFTLQSFFKLLLLFVLLITGVILKTPSLAPIVEARNLKASPPTSVLEADSSQEIQQLYFRVFTSQSSAAAL